VSASGSDGRDAPPYFERHVFVCGNERPEGHPRGCCKSKGSTVLRDYMKARAKEAGLGRVRVNMAGCLDRCEFGPSLVVYPEGVWYSPKTKADIDEIIETHLKADGRVARLLMPTR
jgi:(2Fe-2S) ferredoxin